MNWTQILAKAGIPESPGRPEAVQQAYEATRQRKQRLLKPPPEPKPKRTHRKRRS